MSRIAVNVKSTMKIMSQAGRAQSSGDQIMVPKVVTRSREMWLRIPTAYSPVKTTNEGDSHFRQRAIAPVSAARITAQIGRQSSECVTLRCHVIISSGLLEKKSRKTSESGKMEPSMSAQVVRRRFPIAVGGNRSRPPKAALPIKAPAIPWVIVSIEKIDEIFRGQRAWGKSLAAR